MTDAQKYRMRLVHAHMDYTTLTIPDIDSMNDSPVEPYENAVQLFCAIPRSNHISAITIISELSADIAESSNSKHFDAEPA